MMRILLVALFGLNLGCLSGAAEASDEHLSGIYEGHIGPTPAMLTLRVSGSAVSGLIKRSEGPDISLNGTLSEGRIVGAASTSRGTGFFEAYREFGALIIVLRETGTVTGQVVEARTEFISTNEAKTEDQARTTAPQRDQKLVGTWTTHAHVPRGDMVLPVTSTMTLGRDGRYAHTSEPVPDSRQGEWRSHNGYLEYRPQDAGAWTELGQYQVHGETLVIVLPDTSPQLWSRTSR